jgi:hypothetical protein
MSLVVLDSAWMACVDGSCDFYFYLKYSIYIFRVKLNYCNCTVFLRNQKLGHLDLLCSLRHRLPTCCVLVEFHPLVHVIISIVLGVAR